MASRAAVAAATKQRYEYQASVYTALSDSTRLRIIDVVRESGDVPMTVTGIVSKLGILSQPTISHHLGILTRAGLLKREKVGVWALVSVNEQRISEVGSWLAPVAQ